MNTRRNKIVVTLCAVLALAFTGCSEREVEDLKSGATASDIQIQTVNYSTDNGTLNNKSTVTFSIDVKNLGGLDLAGATVQAYINNKAAGFAKTGELGYNGSENSEKTVTIDWDAVAGEHSAVFYLITDSTAFTDEGNKRLDLEVGVVEIKVEKSEQVAISVGETEINSLVTGDQAPAEIVENIETLINASADKSKNEVAVLKTIETIADDNLTIAEGTAPTLVTFDDPKVSALFLPLASKENPAVAEEGSFLISISTEIEEVTASEITATGEVIKTTEPKKVSVPVAVKRNAAVGSTSFENGLGGITVNKNGEIQVHTSTRSDVTDFWVTIAAKLTSAAENYAVAMAVVDITPKGQLDASVAFAAEMVQIINGYNLYENVIASTEITVTVLRKVSQTKAEDAPNDLIITTYDVFAASVNGSVIGTYTSINNGTAYIFSTDIEGKTYTLTVTSSYTQQRIVDYYAHDQGGSVQQ